MTKILTPAQLAQAYKNACMAELQALKPGNVHVFADGHGMTIDDFIMSADVSAAMISAPGLSVGERILSATAATQKAVGLNTNLGMVLLCAPLIYAASRQSTDAAQTLRQRLVVVLNQLTIADAQQTAQAIVLANPAGLGDAPENCVHDEVGATLLEMMCSAQDKDRIAWQFTHAYSDIFEFGMTCYLKALSKWENQAWATTALYLGFLARHLDTHIVRKYGEVIAKEVIAEAQELEADYWGTDNPKLVQQQLLNWDASLKSRNINPGTSADLTVASLLAVYLS